ncbi:hypothetical protein MJO29_006936 [Puccinia striiformis f. sp. tritici]|uniref:Uncharacterized protein n=4 Tax=Puccinia striiformis TaxID=27350 RepID=A0A0L0VGX3_9BASI|nr:hypothetical protein MJO29_006936 [Puccinia striiformis f. sp. tritici]KNE98525.1 hypothetical protein PSTG_08266 [Puccinia striiformis f. sp. tritici PST-78]
MAISNSFSSFRSIKRPATSTNVNRENESSIPIQTSGSLPGTHPTFEPTRNTNNMAVIQSLQGKKLEKKNKFKLFSRFSIRSSNKKQVINSTATNPTVNVSTTSASLGNILSNDSALVSSGSSTPSRNLSLNSPLRIKPKTNHLSSCDEPGYIFCATDAWTTPDTQSPMNMPARPAKPFWKRLSFSPSAHGHGEEADVVGSPEVIASPAEEVIQASASSDDHPCSIMSSELSSVPSSASETADTSLASADEAETEECGLAGIGVRDRRSICLHSLPIRGGLSHQLTGPKPPFHSAMRYAPSSSSPLSGTLDPPSSDSEDRPPSRNNSPASKRLSTQSYRPPPPMSNLSSINDRRMSYGHLNMVPNQTSVDSETLMRILRGPSSYPEETCPRPQSRAGSISIPCV